MLVFLFILEFNLPIGIPGVENAQDLAAALGRLLGVDAGDGHCKTFLQRNGGGAALKDRLIDLLPHVQSRHL